MTYKGEHSTGYLFPTHKRLEHLIRSQHFTIRQPYDFSEGAVYLLRLFDLEDVIIMETGGMKGRRKEITRAELHQTLQKSFNTKMLILNIIVFNRIKKNIKEVFQIICKNIE